MGVKCLSPPNTQCKAVPDTYRALPITRPPQERGEHHRVRGSSFLILSFLLVLICCLLIFPVSEERSLLGMGQSTETLGYSRQPLLAFTFWKIGQENQEVKNASQIQS